MLSYCNDNVQLYFMRRSYLIQNYIIQCLFVCLLGNLFLISEKSNTFLTTLEYSCSLTWGALGNFEILEHKLWLTLRRAKPKLDLT